VAGTFPRVKVDLGTRAVRLCRPNASAPPWRGLNSVVPGLGRLQAGRVWSGVEGYLPDHVARDRRERDHPWAGACLRLLGHGFQLAPGVGAVVAELVSTGVSETPIDAICAGRRFADGAVVDDNLWREFDPELVAHFRQTQAGTAEASRPEL
jgi:sarcosine oxidase subunit beta